MVMIWETILMMIGVSTMMMTMMIKAYVFLGVVMVGGHQEASLVNKVTENLILVLAGVWIVGLLFLIHFISRLLDGLVQPLPQLVVSHARTSHYIHAEKLKKKQLLNWLIQLQGDFIK